ncbi:MAG: glycosyl hydrolase 115 family protein [Chthoniobacteraceae bacterium]
MRNPTLVLSCSILLSLLAGVGADAFTLTDQVKTASDFPLVVQGRAAQVVVDAADAQVVQVAAGLFAGDVERVSGVKPVVGKAVSAKTPVIIAGTLGKSVLVDQLAAAGKLKDLAKLKGGWETTLWQIVEQPFPGVAQALVIVGSDRRGTAYGLMDLSAKIGVSPWCWWADVPAQPHSALVIQVPAPETDAPAVKYRGIFINDEDWGLNQWAAKTFDPEFKNIGPKTYDKVFELMLRLRLNYIWPAMHACSAEFGSQPENIALADKYGIVAGASHCEAMLFNNVHWDKATQGPWNYRTNREAIHSTWENNVKSRSTEEAVWTLGIRGIHDAPMETPPKDTAGKLELLTTILRDQRALLDQYVTKQYGPVAQCFVPYKEVLPVYDAGLQVPDDVTIVWVDDNFGYLRRLGAPADRKRSGGAGVYWHISYFGSPHSYTWINTTPPALMWEELYKAWENDARRLWVLNVGDIKPMEIGIDYYAKLAWNPEAAGPDSQPRFLREFAAAHFGEKLAQPIAELLGEFYRLGTIRKPELMERAWALALPEPVAAQLQGDYSRLLQTEQKIAAAIPAESRDAYFEMVGFPARVLGASGLIFMADRRAQLGKEAGADDEIAQQRTVS